MDHGLLVSRLVVAKVGFLLECLSDAGNIPMPEDTKAAGEEGLLCTVALDVLIFEKLD
jgi:hypothetical protein